MKTVDTHTMSIITRDRLRLVTLSFSGAFPTTQQIILILDHELEQLHKQIENPRSWGRDLDGDYEVDCLIEKQSYLEIAKDIMSCVTSDILPSSVGSVAKTDVTFAGTSIGEVRVSRGIAYVV